MELPVSAKGGGKSRMEKYPLGDSALLFVWSADRGETGIRPAEIAARAARVRALALPGVKECVPSFRTIAVHLDLTALAAAGDAPHAIAEAVRGLAERLVREFAADVSALEPAAMPRVVTLPVVYGGEDGPDLPACAERSGLSEAAFVEAHAAADYEVALIGFAPGFPYLSGLPDVLAQPRRKTPRLQVPAGAVGIAGGQTGVYPVASPGGWQLIGRTAVPLFRPEAEKPFLLEPGDRVVFKPVDRHPEAESSFAEQPDNASANVPSAEQQAAASGERVLEVRKPGMLTTVQDRGRFGWQAYGVSIGGAMDSMALRTANALVGNAEDAAALEMTLIGAAFEASIDLLVAICGADLDVRAGEERVPMNRPVWLRAGTKLTFGNARRGCRAYLAVAGGIDTPPTLGSRSADARLGLHGPGGRALLTGDRLAIGAPSLFGDMLASALRAQAVQQGRSWASTAWQALPPGSGRMVFGQPLEIRVVRGVHWESFTAEGRQRLFRDTYTVAADSDRMGIRLSGPPVAWSRQQELVSQGVVPGTIQVPADGQPIVLAAGCQPTGGYPIVAHVITADLPLLGQCAPGSVLKFRLIEMEEAWLAWRANERQFRWLLAGIRQQGKRDAKWLQTGLQSI